MVTKWKIDASSKKKKKKNCGKLMETTSKEKPILGHSYPKEEIYYDKFTVWFKPLNSVSIL